MEHISQFGLSHHFFQVSGHPISSNKVISLRMHRKPSGCVVREAGVGALWWLLSLLAPSLWWTVGPGQFCYVYRPAVRMLISNHRTRLQRTILESAGMSYSITYFSTSPPVAQLGKNLPAVRETWVRSLGWEDPLEKGKATHSSILAWRIPWTV